MKRINNLDKSCHSCKDCKYNEDFCSLREALPSDIGKKEIINGIEYTKNCSGFEWD